MTKNRHIVQYLIIVPLWLSLSACLLEGPSGSSLISGSPPLHAGVDIEYSFWHTELVTRGNAINFSIINKAAWTSLDQITGHLGGIPDDADVGTCNNIEITATDAEILAMRTYYFAVTAVNSEGVDGERFNVVVMLAA